jgi:hypothetical protein
MRPGAKQDRPGNSDREAQLKACSDSAAWPLSYLDDIDHRTRQAAAIALDRYVAAKRLGGIRGAAWVPGWPVWRSRHPLVGTTKHGIVFVGSGKSDQAVDSGRSGPQNDQIL